MRLFRTLSLLLLGALLFVGAYRFVMPSKIYGEWELVYLKGLEQALEAEEKKLADKGEDIFWSLEDSLEQISLSYKSNLLLNKTVSTYHTCVRHTSYFRGLIYEDFDDITFKSFDPVQALDCGRAVHIVTTTYSALSIDRFRLDDNNQTLIFEDAVQNELARFKRAMARS